jgi:hypothetical protein
MSFSKSMITDEPDLDQISGYGHAQAERGMSLDEAIHEFITVTKRANELYSRKKELVSFLSGTAWDSRGEQKTVHLSASDGARIKVEFKTEKSYEPGQMFTVADLLGKDVFDGLFNTKVEFVPKTRNLNAFMNTVHADERVETAKQIIREATTEMQKSPYISTEKAA